MASPQRQSRLYTVREKCTVQLKMLEDEVRLMVDNPMMIPGNENGLFDRIEDKLAEMHEFQGILTVLDTYFKD
jgi:hypothetical protein